MSIEPSILEVIDFLKAGYLPSTADRTAVLVDVSDASYYFTDFVADLDLLGIMIENNSSSYQKYCPMSELASSIVADFDAADDSSFRLSCEFLKTCGSINFALSMVVNDFHVSYDLFFDFPCIK